MTCLFCSIASGSEPAHIVHSDEHTLTFLDIRPLFLGHCLVIPKKHIETLMDLPEAAIAPLFQQAKKIAVAVQEAMGAEGIFMANNNRVSQSVAHLHVHIVPRKKKDGLKGFFWPRVKPTQADLAAAAAAIKAKL